MAKVNCLDCIHWRGGYLECKYGFRMAANANGSGVSRKEDVWFCQDYEEKQDEEDYDDV